MRTTMNDRGSAAACLATNVPPFDAGTASASLARTELEELNDALRILTEAFPNVRLEVFREMLTTLSKESRAQVVAEHLLRKGADERWIRGRWRVQEAEVGVETPMSTESEGDGSSKILAEVKNLKTRTGKGFWAGKGQQERQQAPSAVKGMLPSTHTAEGSKGTEDVESKAFVDVGHRDQDFTTQASAVPLEETFRTASYKTAVSTALRNEFRSLSKSTISGVLAEQNHCYTLARPILAGLAAKTWRTSIGNLVMRAFGFGAGSANKAKNGSTVSTDESHYMLQWGPGPLDDKMLRTPSLRKTGDAELDEELRTMLLDPILQKRQKRENQISLELAVLLNEHEAEMAGAMFECQVCFADVAFEQMAVCSGSDEGHVICFECVQRSLAQAMYGQSWELTVDHKRGQIACLAPADSPCNGCIPQSLAERAVVAGKGGWVVWQAFQTRLADEALRKSGAEAIKCPFCPYLEIDALHLPAQPVWTLSLRDPLQTLLHLILGLVILVAALVLILLPLTLIHLLISPLIPLRSGPSGLLHSVQRTWRLALASSIRHTHLSRRFQCRSPSCARASCLDCRKAWRDPHRCHESAAHSLRTTVEAARTAALKRTCPRCGVSFVKASGCNKMVCICGYAMCYICREGLKAKDRVDADAVQGGGGGAAAVPQENAGNANDGEGYRHFCQHFRPNGGRCVECDKCDLYRAEDEDEIVRRAGERAEVEWRRRNGIDDDVVLPTEGVGGNNSGDGGSWRTRSKIRLFCHALSRLTLQKAFTWWIDKVLVSKLDKSFTGKNSGIR